MIERLIHTGDSANIAFYREEPSGPLHVWAEVLRSVPMRRGENGLEIAPGPVTYYATVYRIGSGRIGSAETTRSLEAAPERLEPDEVLELVRRVLEIRGLAGIKP
jgi:hypothetical protein